MTFFELWGEAVVVASCIAAATGCFVLNRRVQRLASTERGIGKAVSEMSRSVGQFEELLVAAEGSTREASTILDEQLVQARRLVARLEMLGGAAPRTGTTSKPSPRPAAPADPLADIVPKGAAAATPTGQPGAGATMSNGSAQKRLADLAQRRATTATAAAGLGRGPQA
jgi:hypothetical protein